MKGVSPKCAININNVTRLPAAQKEGEARLCRPLPAAGTDLDNAVRPQLLYR